MEKAHILRYTLATIVLSFGNLSRVTRSLFGLIPENSLLDKCPYYRLPQSEDAPSVPRQLKWVVETRAKSSKRSGSSSASSGRSSGLIALRSKKEYKRDRLTLPGMVVLYNTLLAWMMFTIEIRASSL